MNTESDPFTLAVMRLWSAAIVGPDGPNSVPGDIDDDCGLSAPSPCLDVANNQMAAFDFCDLDRYGVLGELQPYDLAMNPRFVDDASADTGFGPASIAGMGGDERVAPGCLADFNGDGFLDFFDYDDFVSSFESGC